MDPASVATPRATHLAAARSLEIASELRAAMSEDDEARSALLLSELLQLRGLTRSQRARLQLHALLQLLRALRALAQNDELTGLNNRRGFMQTATRLLDLLSRDGQRAHLVYFSLGQVSELRALIGAAPTDLLIRQMGNFLRDLFPSYGVYEVLGRLGATEFAALTPNDDYASRHAILRRSQASWPGWDVAALPLRIAVARFEPEQPLTIEELLSVAAQSASADAAEPVCEDAPAGYAPQPDLALC